MRCSAHKDACALGKSKELAVGGDVLVLTLVRLFVDYSRSFSMWWGAEDNKVTKMSRSVHQSVFIF